MSVGNLEGGLAEDKEEEVELLNAPRFADDDDDISEIFFAGLVALDGAVALDPSFDFKRGNFDWVNAKDFLTLVEPEDLLFPSSLLILL